MKLSNEDRERLMKLPKSKLLELAKEIKRIVRDSKRQGIETAHIRAAVAMELALKK